MLTLMTLTSFIADWFFTLWKTLTARERERERGRVAVGVNRLPNLRSSLAKYTKYYVSFLDWRRRDITKIRGESSFLKGSRKFLSWLYHEAEPSNIIIIKIFSTLLKTYFPPEFLLYLVFSNRGKTHNILCTWLKKILNVSICLQPTAPLFLSLSRGQRLS